MTEADYLIIANEYVNTTFMLFGILFSLISAFLTVSYLAGKNFSALVSGVLLLLYTMSYFFVGGAIINSNFQMAAFIEKMNASEFDFSWTVFDTVDTEFIAANTLVILSYIFTIIFFLYTKFRSER